MMFDEDWEAWLESEAEGRLEPSDYGPQCN